MQQVLLSPELPLDLVAFDGLLSTWRLLAAHTACLQSLLG